MDFWIPPTAIEVKVTGSPAAVLRQLYRYAADEQVEALLLVTTRSAHRDLAGIVLGKPLRVLYVSPL